LGIPTLTPEKSTNVTLGFGLNPNKNLSFSLDYFSINVKDRIVYSSSITTDDRLLAVPTTELGRILKGTAVGAKNFDLKSVQFFINGIETNTSGLDYVLSYRNIELGSGKLALNLAGNYMLKNEIVGAPSEPSPVKAAGSSILNTQIRSLLTESRPKYKTILGFDYSIGKLNINLNNTLFGKTAFRDFDNGPGFGDIGLTAAGGDRNVMNDLKAEFKPAVVTDLSLGYAFTDKVSFALNVNNLLGVLPKWDLVSLSSDGDALLKNAAAKSLVRGFLGFSGRYDILGYNGSQFSQLGRIFNAQMTIKF
jgi:iron complex outermembrane recepter protein